MRVTSVQIVIGIWALLIVVAGIYNLSGQPSTPATTVNSEVTAAAPCVPLVQTEADKTVVLRVDDVQAWTWPSTTRMMITDAEVRNIPLTLGIIPKGFSQDTELVAFLQSRTCRHELALHGFDHRSRGVNEELAEFEDLSKDEAKQRLEAGLTDLRHVSKRPIQTWIPPLNRHSTGTREALIELGVTRHSTEGDGVWDYDAATFTYDTNALTDTDQVLANCASTFETSDACIIMLHPQDFTTDNWHDAEKYETYYLDLLDRLSAAGYGFATFADIDEA